MPLTTDEQPSEVERLQTDLQSNEPQTRVRAARRLWELGHPDALDANLKTLDDAPDSLHRDYTPAVGVLIDIGEPALQPLLERLDAADELTRRRAHHAVLGITRKLFDFDPQRGWPAGAEARWHAWWAQIGYDPSSDAAARRQAIDRLAAWLEQRRAPPQDP